MININNSLILDHSLKFIPVTEAHRDNGYYKYEQQERDSPYSYGA